MSFRVLILEGVTIPTVVGKVKIDAIMHSQCHAQQLLLALDQRSKSYFAQIRPKTNLLTFLH